MLTDKLDPSTLKTVRENCHNVKSWDLFYKLSEADAYMHM